MGRRKFRAVAFDLNGTILDDAELFYLRGLTPAFEKYGIELPEYEELRYEYSMLGPDKFVAMAGHLHNRTITWERDINPLVTDFLSGEKRPRLAYGARLVLEELRADEIPMALISGLNAEQFAKAVERLRLKRYFVPRTKDDLRMCRGGLRHKTATLRAFARRIGCDPNQIVFVSDIYKDLMEAQLARCFTVGYTKGYGSLESLEEARPDDSCNFDIIDSFSEFFDLGEFRPKK